MSESNRANVALSITIAAVALLAGYVVFAAMGDKSTTSTKPPIVDSQNKVLDVVFVIDATASMSDEIEQVKAEVVSVADQLSGENPGAKIRFGLVLYKDTTDDFVTRVTPLSFDTQKVRGLLEQITVSGGGDYPEHVGAGLHEAIAFDWAPDAERVIYLVGDAPSQDHGDGKTVSTALQLAKSNGIVVRTLGCSGIERDGAAGRNEFQMIAQMTGGTYRDLTYHAVVVGDDGRKRSVIYEGGEAYEADRVLDAEEWSAGSGALREKGMVKPAAAPTRAKADRAEKKSNVIEVIKGDF